jgi:NAD-dependent histone deacetylase SIR2
MDADASLRYPSPSSSLVSLESTDSAPRPKVPRIKLIASKRPAVSRLPSSPSGKRWRGPPRSKERTTEHLDLINVIEGGSTEAHPLVRRLVRALRHKKKIVVVAGAGISVSAGVPDFRSARGLFKSAGKELFDASVYKHNDSTESFHTMVRELGRLSRKARPTEFHHLLAALAQEGRLMRLYSQNVDGIDTALEPLRTTVPLNVKGPWPKTIQLHGGLDKMVCTKCSELQDFDPAVFSGPEPPPCGRCEAMEEARTAGDLRGRGVGRLRPRMVLYNEFNPDADAIGKVSEADLRRGADAVIVVGTTLKIPGVRRLVKELCLKTRSRRDGFTAWINIDAEPQGAEFKDCFDLVVQGSSEDVAVLAGLPRWDSSDEYQILSEDEALRLREESEGRGKVEVCISPVEEAEYDVDASDKKFQLGAAIGIPTPGASPKLGPQKIVEGEPTRARQTKLEFGAKTEDDSEDAKTDSDKPGRGRPKGALGIKKRTALPTVEAAKSRRALSTTKTSKARPRTVLLTQKAATASKRTALPTGRANGRKRADQHAVAAAPSALILDTFKTSKATEAAPLVTAKEQKRKAGITADAPASKRPRRNASSESPVEYNNTLGEVENEAAVKRSRTTAANGVDLVTSLPALRPPKEKVLGAVPRTGCARV